MNAPAPPAIDAEPAVGEFSDCRKFLHEALSSAARLYVVVDSAQNAELARTAWFDHGFETWSLFGENVDASMSSVAPHLVAVSSGRSGRDFLDVWADHLWTNAGILLSCPADPVKVWEHLSRLFVVGDPEGRLMYFRFYDPRILRALMPTLRDSQISEVFGPIREFLVEDAVPGSISRWRPVRDGVECDRWRLAGDEAGAAEPPIDGPHFAEGRHATPRKPAIRSGRA
jgi:Domain of unknown function (DUF4123)